MGSDDEATYDASDSLVNQLLASKGAHVSPVDISPRLDGHHAAQVGDKAGVLFPQHGPLLILKFKTTTYRLIDGQHNFRPVSSHGLVVYTNVMA